MSKEMEELYDALIMQVKREISKSMIEDGLTVERTARILKVDENEVKKWFSDDGFTAV